MNGARPEGDGGRHAATLTRYTALLVRGAEPAAAARDAFGDQGAEALVILVAGRAAVKVIAQARKPRIGVDAGQFELDVLVE